MARATARRVTEWAQVDHERERAQRREDQAR
ncbi:hypothetical protein J2Z30_005865 [Streptomyces iranensis]|uniref:Uncharacterized protein n=1 Tax=Streptomyces iranensis TaxID=576784 RepID=A0ABS4MYL8_9ACTN|nr:hypothetical protein [Streptomyces iranensis]